MEESTYYEELGWAKALEDSIKAWRKRIHVPSVPSSTVCPLCVFSTTLSDDKRVRCDIGQTCPVSRKTGEEKCINTPMVDYDSSLHKDYLKNRVDASPQANIARREVLFLQSCRDTLNLENPPMEKSGLIQMKFLDEDQHQVCSESMLGFDEMILALEDMYDKDSEEFRLGIAEILISTK